MWPPAKRAHIAASPIQLNGPVIGRPPNLCSPDGSETTEPLCHLEALEDLAWGSLEEVSELLPMCRAKPCNPEQVAVHQGYVHVDTIVPAEKDVIANHEDKAPLDHVVVLRAVIDVPKSRTVERNSCPTKPTSPKWAILETVEHPAVIMSAVRHRP